MDKKSNAKKNVIVVETETKENMFVSCWNFGRKKGEYTCSSTTQKRIPTFVISSKEKD